MHFLFTIFFSNMSSLLYENVVLFPRNLNPSLHLLNLINKYLLGNGKNKGLFKRVRILSKCYCDQCRHYVLRFRGRTLFFSRQKDFDKSDINQTIRQLFKEFNTQKNSKSYCLEKNKVERRVRILSKCYCDQCGNSVLRFCGRTLFFSR